MAELARSLAPRYVATRSMKTGRAGPVPDRALRLLLGHGRFLCLPALVATATATLLAGGAWLWLGAALFFLASTLGDELFGDTGIVAGEPSSVFHEFMLYLSAALAAAMMVAWAAFLGSAHWPVDFAAARQATGPAGMVGAVISVGICLAAVSGIVGHELMHRLRPLPFLTGQWVLSMCFYSAYMLEHIWGHHPDVGLAGDTATAARGMSLWRFIARSLVEGHRNAARREASRLRRRGRGLLSPANRLLRGHAMGAAWLALFWICAGPAGIAGIAASAAVAILIIEAYSYVGHYGLLRVAGEPVAPRHSWNSYRGAMGGLLFNLPRHSSHHMSAAVPYWRLQPAEAAPVLPFGVSIMAMLAAVPPAFRRVIAGPLAAWDRELASPAERALASRSPGGAAK